MCRKLWFIGLFVVLWGVGSAPAAFDPLADPNLIGWWRCDEGQGSVVSDSSPNGNDGTFINGDPLWTTGFRGEGTGIRLITPTLVEIPSINITLTQATMAGWFLPNGAQTSWASIIMHRGSGVAHGFNLLSDRRLAYHWNDDQASWSYRGDAYYAADEWTHCAVTVEPTKATFYVNGVAASTNSIAHAAATWDNPFHLGGDNRTSDSPLRRMNGSLDDVMFFSRALTAAEIKSLVPPQLKAYKPDPPDGKIDATMPLLMWTKGDTAVLHNVYLGTSPELTEADQVAENLSWPTYYHQTPLSPGITYYWRVDEIEVNGTVHQGNVWRFEMMPLTAYLPQPADGSEEVFPSVTLSWNAGANAMQHHVYFSSVFADVESRAAAADQGEIDETKYNPGLLRASTTYFWCVDEVKLLGGVVDKGAVWSFTVEDGVKNKIVRQWWSGIGGTAIGDLTSNQNYPDNPTGTELLDVFEGPVDWADNYGTRMYGWLTPPESGDFTFWIAGDDNQELHLSTDADPANATVIARVTSWTSSREWTKEAGQQSAPIALQAGQKYFIQALGKEGGGGDNIAVSWQGPGIAAQAIISAEYVDTFALSPLQAFLPSPADGQVDAPQAPVLSWSAGEKAQQHEVYLGDDPNAVAAADTSSPLFQGRQAGTSYDAGDLEWGKTFYWRVDEINEGDPESPWIGRVWSFTTANFISVDDFESYNDEEGMDTRIYENWIDGWMTGNGSTVGNWDAPFAEQTIVHGGLQSMPFDYNNLVAPFYSEAYREFAPVQNWTVNGMTDLSLWIQGYPVLETIAVTETAGQMSVTGDGADIWYSSDEFTFAYKTLTGNGSIVARVVSNGTGSNAWAKGGVMIRDSLDGGSAFANMVVTGGNGNGAAFQWRLVADTDAAAGADPTTAVAPPYWVKIERMGSDIAGYYSADGSFWVQLDMTQTIAMADPVYIGICVTSHAAGEDRTYEFDNIKTTGGVSGGWQGAIITAPVHNSPQPLYVTVEDSTGKKATVTHPDPAAVNIADWTEWKIPLTDLAGVSLSKVKRLYLGVGDKSAAGHGKLYIDDIRVVRPEPTP